MNLRKKALVALSVPIFASCGVVDSITAKINSAVSDLTSATSGNLQDLVDSSSVSAKAVGEQLSTLKGEAAKPSQDTRFEIPSSAKRGLSTQADDTDNCPAIERTFDPDTGTRTSTSDYSKCKDGRGGVIKSTLTESALERELTVEFEDYIDGAETKNGTIVWEITVTSDPENPENSKIEVSADEDLTIILLRETEAGIQLPVTVVSDSRISYELLSLDGTLEIDGGGDIKQDGKSSELDFDSVLFNFASKDGCKKGPIEGVVKMSNEEGDFTIDIKLAATQPETDAEGVTTKKAAADVEKIFKETLDALQEFFTDLDSVISDEGLINFCSANADDYVDSAETDNDNSDNNVRDRASTSIQPKESDGGGFGVAIPDGLSFADDDWYRIVNLPAGTYAIEAMPKSPEALWPFICVENTAGDLISTLPGDGAVDCFPGFVDVVLDSEQDIFIQITDPFGEYQCQTYTFAVYDVASGFPPPDLPTFDPSAGGGGFAGNCPIDWISDEICDLPCHDFWTSQGEDITADEAVCVDGPGPTGPGAGECPLIWIGDGVCDGFCIDFWGPDAEHPTNGRMNGTDDGGDCGAGGGLPPEPQTCTGNDVICNIGGAPAVDTCVDKFNFEQEMCGTQFCPQGEGLVAEYDPQFNDIFCVPEQF